MSLLSSKLSDSNLLLLSVKPKSFLGLNNLALPCSADLTLGATLSHVSLAVAIWNSVLFL